jgi:diaminopimelate epimerase
MQLIPFYKYQGVTGNDFVVIDDRQELFFKKIPNSIQRLCIVNGGRCRRIDIPSSRE